MRTVTYRLEDLQRAVITIGFVGENEHTHVIFDAKRVFDDYPTALPSLTVRPPDGDPYPAVVAREGDLLTWEILDSDLTKDGLGEFQLTFVVDTVVAKTFIGKTRIHKSLMPTGEVPEPIDDWITQANAELAALPETIDAAIEAAKESGAFDGFSPIVEVTPSADGHNVTITDKEGAKTFDVADGHDGKDGHDPVRGVDYWTTADKAEILSDTEDYADDIVKVQDLQPTEHANKVWFTETPPQSVQVPTYTELTDLQSAITSFSDAIYQTNNVDVSLTISEGEYYKLTGKHSTYNQAKCSQVIPVTAGSKVLVTAKSRSAVAGIIFYNSDTLSESTFVSYDCYTGETVTFTNQEVTVPTGATHCIVQGDIDGSLALKKRETINKIDKNATDIAALQIDEDKVDDTYDAVFEEEHSSVALTMTEGKYYKLTGKYGTYDQAKCSQVIEVTAGEKLYVTAKSQASVAGILFYDSSSASESTFISYDCYTGQTVTFTEQEVTVPVGATHAVVQGNINSTVALERISMGSKVQKNAQNITAIKNDDDYLNSVLRQRFMAIAKNFSWGTYPKMIISLRVDDLRTDIDLFAKIITGEYGFPLDVAACVKNIDKTVTGIVDPAEKIGDTRLEVCQWVQEHGGEVLVHPDTTFADATKIKELFLDSKRTFEDNGIHIRGTAVANSTPDAALKEKLDPYLYLYYDFSDAYGTNPPYNGMTFTMMNNFNNDIDDFESWLNTRTAYQTPVWVTLVMHEIGVDVTETFLRDVLDLIQTNVTQGKVAVMLWSEVYDTYGTF